VTLRGELRTLVEATLSGPRSTPAVVAEVLREAILRGILTAGQQLRQEEIARQLGVSHIPVREALRQLEAEGLVRLRPYRGFEVSELSPEEVEELYEIRIPLECQALRLALPHLTDQDLEQAQAVLDAIDAEADPSVWSELNTRFHAILYAPSRRQRLLNLIRTLRTNVDRYLRLYISVMQRKAHSQREHRAILEAVRRRDEAQALRALEEHLDIACRMLVDYLRRDQYRGEAEGDGSP
jgi:DNA-binding GntR family transcriptional regulator